MPNQRTPLNKARLTGQAKKKPGRYENRTEPSAKEYPEAMSGIGDPSPWLTSKQQEAFLGIKHCFPWATESSRIAVEMASKLYARLMDPEVVQVASEISQLRALIASFGGTPADLTRISDGVQVVARKAERAEQDAQRDKDHRTNSEKYFN